jgi:hypothetical protein
LDTLNEIIDPIEQSFVDVRQIGFLRFKTGDQHVGWIVEFDLRTKESGRCDGCNANGLSCVSIEGVGILLRPLTDASSQSLTTGQHGATPSVKINQTQSVAACLNEVIVSHQDYILSSGWKSKKPCVPATFRSLDQSKSWIVEFDLRAKEPAGGYRGDPYDLTGTPVESVSVLLRP